jgi:hypothetical protein
MALAIALLISIAQREAHAQWIHRGYSLGQVDLTSAQIVYRTVDGVLAKSTDAGVTWSVLDKTAFTNFTIGQQLIFETGAIKIHFIDDATGFYYGTNLIATHQVIFRTNDAGVSWTLVHNDVGGNINQLYFVSSLVGFAAGDEGRVLKTTNGGKSWSYVTSSGPNALNDIFAHDANVVFVAGKSGIKRSLNGGQTWATVSTRQDLISISFLNTNTGVAIGRDEILSTIDGGLTWAPAKINAPKNTRFTRVRFEKTFGLLGTETGLYKSSDGIFWTFQPSLEYQKISSFDVADNFAFLISSTGQVTNAYYSSTGGDAIPSSEVAMLDIQSYSEENCRGTYPIRTRIINLGSKPLTSVKLTWNVDNLTETVYNWSGNIHSGDTSDYFSVGDFNFSKTGHNYQIKLGVSLPNSNTDEYNLNNEVVATQRMSLFNGSYTIGARPGDDFQDLYSALGLLQNSRACDTNAIIFNIEPGTYYGDHRVDHLNLAAGQKIIIQSSTGVASDVVFEANEFGLVFNSGNIEINNITWKAKKSSAISAVSYRSGDHASLKIKGNIFITEPVYQTSGLQLYSAGNFVITDNKFLRGSTGINFAQDLLVSDKPSVLEITNNQFNDVEGGCIHIQSTNAMIDISRNKMHFDLPYPKANNALFIIDAIGRTVIANNLMEVNSPGQSPTLSLVTLVSTKNINMYYNTLSVLNQGASPVLFLSNCTDVNIINNILANYGPGSIYGIGDLNRSVTCDHNALFSTGTFAYTTFPIKTHDLWTSQTGYDVHSVIADPQLNHGDPHIALLNSNYGIANAGIHIPDVLEDIDGELRDTQNPDIGADEFAQPLTDLALIKVDGANLSRCSGSAVVKVGVRNFGSTNATAFNVLWAVDGVDQIPVTGITLSAGTMSVVEFPALDFTLGNHKIKVQLTNNPGDAISRNDSVTLWLEIRNGLSGTYTVGGVSPDFATIAQAAENLRLNGVCGPVIMKIRPGVYNDRVVFGRCPGVNVENQITFKSEVADSTQVEINYSDYYALTFENSEWVTLSGVTVKSNYPVRVEGSSHITITNSHISTSVESGDLSDFVTVSNNYIGRPDLAAPAIKMLSFFTSNGINISNNNIPDGYIWLTGQTDLKIIGNKVSAIRLSKILTGYEISGNRLSNGGELLIENSRSLSPIPRHIFNNTFTNGNIALSDADNVNIFHNTIFAKSISGFAAVQLNLLTSDLQGPIKFKNNIIVAEGYPVLIYNRNSETEIDHNVYWTDYGFPFNSVDGQQTYLYYPHTLRYKTLDEYQQKTSQDQHSQFIKPFFVSANDLHISGDARIKGKGTQLAIESDIDGQLRDTTHPDPGSDEFTFVPKGNDTGVTFIKRPATCGATQKVYATITNFGTSPVTSTNVRWKTQHTEVQEFAWTGSLLPGASIEIEIGLAELRPSVTYELTAWTTTPNGFQDEDTRNDTISLRNIRQKLAGEYQINQAGQDADFPTPYEFGVYISEVGICQPVVANIAPGTYTRRFFIRNVEGASEANTVIIQSETKDSTSVTIADSGWSFEDYDAPGQYTVLLDSAKFIHLRHIGIESAYMVNGLVIRNGSSDNTLSNLKFRGNSLTSSYPGNLVQFEPGSTYSDNIIQNNVLEGGLNGISTSGIVRNCVVRNNRFKKQNDVMLRIGNSENILIEDNVFDRQVSEHYYNAGGIFMQQAFGDFTIQRNHFTTDGSAISIEYSSPTTGFIINNVINQPDGNSGIYSSQNKNITFGFNTIKVSNTSAIMSSDDKEISIINNNIYHKGTATVTFYNYFYSTNGNTIDYNNVFGEGKYYWYQKMYNTFEEFRTASGMDQHSRSVNPFFVSTTNLHVTNPALLSTGTKINGVAGDFDRKLRPVPPSIGAYEVSLLAGDLSVANILLEDCNSIYITLRNNGQTVIANAGINGTVNGSAVISLLWNGVLEPGQSTPPMLSGTLGPDPSGDYQIIARSTAPNGLADTNATNDELSISHSVFDAIQLGEDQLVCTTPDHPFILAAPNGYLQYDWASGEQSQHVEVVESGEFIVIAHDINGCTSRDSVSIEVTQVTPPTLTFTGSALFASGGDSYTWFLDGNLIEAVTGAEHIPTVPGSYQVKISTQGCDAFSNVLTLIVTSLPSVENNLEFYPNPTTGNLLIRGAAGMSMQLSVRNMVGQEVHREVLNDGQGEYALNLTHLPKGSYIIEVIGTNRRNKFLKLVIE